MPRDPLPDWALARRREIGHRIAKWRRARGWSVDDLAEAAGVPRLTVIRAENAWHSTGLDKLVLLAEALGVSVGQLLDEDPAAGRGTADGGE